MCSVPRESFIGRRCRIIPVTILDGAAPFSSEAERRLAAEDEQDEDEDSDGSDGPIQWRSDSSAADDEDVPICE